MTASLIDLRSDTVTRPTPGMRAAMAAAEVGDDVYGDDPTVLALEARVASMLGKERALFVPSGTMANQLAILGQCRGGDEVVVGEGSHSVWYESGAGAALAGVQFAIAGSGGLFEVAELDAAVKPVADYYPRTSLVAIEDTHNRAGGRVWPLGQLHRVAERARSLGLATHLDGARLWNAEAASGVPVAERARPFDSVTVCLSKGLGAPVGSVLCGSGAFVALARRHRKMLGGGMRQVGVLAAAGLYALDHHRGRIGDDHRRASELALGIVRLLGDDARIDLPSVETNIVNIDVPIDATSVVEGARAVGLLIGASGPRRVRLVTHLDVGDAAIDAAISLFATAVRNAIATPRSTQ